MSTAKGNRFEEEVYEDLGSELSRLGLNPDRCKLFLKKAYYSKDRSASITVDVSIEVYAEGQTEPSLIWIWECKDLSRPVTVEDFEKLHSVLEQIGPDNTKGTIVARGTFTKGARKYAKSKKLGYARYYSKILIMNPFGGWPQEWIDKLQSDFELILSDEDGRYYGMISVVGRRFFGRHTFGKYDYIGSIGEFVRFQILFDTACRLAQEVTNEERAETPRWRLAFNFLRSKLLIHMHSLRLLSRRYFHRVSGHTGPREVSVRRIR